MFLLKCVFTSPRFKKRIKLVTVNRTNIVFVFCWFFGLSTRACDDRWLCGTNWCIGPCWVHLTLWIDHVVFGCLCRRSLWMNARITARFVVHDDWRFAWETHMLWCASENWPVFELNIIRSMWENFHYFAFLPFLRVIPTCTSMNACRIIKVRST